MSRATNNGLVWDFDSLDSCFENPRALVSRTQLNFAGLKDPQGRDDVLAFLRQFSAIPHDIPEAAPNAIPVDPCGRA